MLRRTSKDGCDQVSFSRSNQSVLSYRSFYTKKIGMPLDLPIIKKSSLVKTTVSIFSLVWLMEFSITCLCLGKVKVFSDNSNLKNLLSVQCLHGKGKRSIGARNGGRLYFVYKTVFAVTHCIRKTFHLQQS